MESPTKRSFKNFQNQLLFRKIQVIYLKEFQYYLSQLPIRCDINKAGNKHSIQL